MRGNIILVNNYCEDKSNKIGEWRMMSRKFESSESLKVYKVHKVIKFIKLESGIGDG